MIQLRQLGDILLTTPVFRAIKYAGNDPRRDIHLTFLSHEMGRLIIDGCPYVDEYFTYGNDWTLPMHWRLAQTLRERKFDMVIDFMNNPRSALLAYATGARERIAFRSRRRLFYTDVVPRSANEQYIVQEKFKLTDRAGFPNSHEIKLLLPWFEKHTSAYMKLVGQYPLVNQAPMRVLLSPTHRREVRRWPAESWAELGAALTKQFGAAVVWIWGPGEESVIDQIMGLASAAGVPSGFKAPATTFRELAALIANCDLFIGNSNGPSHVAVAVDTPSIQLHGPTILEAWCPMTAQHRGLQAGGNGQMANISVQRVVDLFEEMQTLVVEKASSRRSKGLRLNWQAQ